MSKSSQQYYVGIASSTKGIEWSMNSKQDRLIQEYISIDKTILYRFTQSIRLHPVNVYTEYTNLSRLSHYKKYCI